MDKTLFTNALLVTPDGVKKGELLTEDGIIRDISDGGAQGASGAEVIDLKGDYLIPGIIELHTDNLEKHLMPRPKIDWPDARSAVFAHDAQIIAAGITTVCDAMSVGEYSDKGRVAMMGRAIAALSEARGTGMLRSDHYLHLRCELPYDRMQSLFREVCDSPVLRLISLMDHTPGQRQWRNLASYRIYHSDYKTWTDEEFREAVKELQEQRDGCADDNAAFAEGAGLNRAPSGFMAPRDMFLGNVKSNVEGIFYAGTVTAPKNIGESLNEGTAAADAAARYVGV
mgnify:CR=1 FL=1